jgi:hypothetical protein
MVSQALSYPERPDSAETRDQQRQLRNDFRNYFAGEARGKGLLRFKTHFKRVTLWLGAVLWFLTIPISFYEGYKILRVGLVEAATIEIIAVTTGIIFGGAVLIMMGSGEGLWKEVLHNFWRYFVLLIAGPSLLLVAWYLHAQGIGVWRDATGAVAALLICGSFFIGSKPPPDDEDIEDALDRVFEADVRRHLTRLLAEIRGGDVRMQDKTGSDEALRLLRRFPQEVELGGRALMARPARDDRPRVTPQGFVALIFEARTLLSCEGAIDLTTGTLTAHRLREIDYRDIGLLSLDGLGVSHAPPKEKAVRVPQARLQMPAMAKPPSSYKTTFSIGLPGNASIDVVLRDGEALGRTRNFAAVADSEVAPLTDFAYVRRTWEMLASARRGSPN